MSHVQRRFVVMVAVMALSLAGCASGPGGTAQPRTSPTITTPSSSAPTPSPASTVRPAVPEILRFAAPTVGGAPFDGASLAGRPAVLWFWAAWCARCRAKAADVSAAQADHPKVSFVGVAGLGSGNDAMARFVSQNSLGAFPHLADDAGSVWRHFGVTEQEYFILIDAAGKVVHKGPLSVDELSQRVAALAG